MRRTLFALSVMFTSVMTPPSTAHAVSGRCPQYEQQLAAYPGWNVSRMSRIMWRESRCDASAYNGRRRDRSYGLLQLNTKTTPRLDLWGELRWRCGLTAREQLWDASTNIACAHRLFLAYGMRPWGTR